MTPDKPTDPDDAPATDTTPDDPGIPPPVVDITPPASEVKYFQHEPTASQRKRMMAPPTRVVVQGKPNNRAYRRAEAAFHRKNPKPTTKGSPS